MIEIRHELKLDRISTDDAFLKGCSYPHCSGRVTHRATIPANFSKRVNTGFVLTTFEQVVYHRHYCEVHGRRFAERNNLPFGVTP